MPHTVKRGDTKTLQWNLDRDLTAVSEAKVIIKAPGDPAPAVERVANILSPPSQGIVELALQAADYGATKLRRTGGAALPHFRVECQTQPGPLTHPDDAHGYERLYVWDDLG